MKLWIAIVIALAVTVPAHASERAEHALEGGNYARARTIGQADGTVAGLMTACRAGMLLGGYIESSDTAVKSLHGAAKDCLGVIAQDSRHLNARITLAVVIGFEAKRWRKPGLAKQSKHLLQQILADFPGAPDAHGALGGWHSEVSAAGFFARLYLGAKRRTAGRYFDGAIAKGEKTIPFYLEYIKFLARGNKDDRGRAIEIANAILKQPTKDAVDRLMQTKISEVLVALRNGEKQVIKKAIASATAFNGIEKWRSVPPIKFNLPE